MPRRFNPKRKILSATMDSVDLERLAQRVRYGGNPEHKKNPGDFGLHPPATPRTDKSECDGTGVFTRAEAIALLRKGVQRGLISQQSRNGLPQNIWAVSKEGIPLEAQLENETAAVYHGYPMPANDSLRDEILRKWVQHEQ